MPPNLARDAVSVVPKLVLLRARQWIILGVCKGVVRQKTLTCAEARKTFKGVLSAPKLIQPEPAGSAPGVQPKGDSEVMAVDSARLEELEKGDTVERDVVPLGPPAKRSRKSR